jgi:colanic acid/amylovoran biosynthesis glycosyltransferase
MRIAFLVGRFPSLSETFILNQITGLIDRGHDVDIIASIPESVDTVHSDVITYDLGRRTHYLSYYPRTRLLRLLKGLVVCTPKCLKAPSRFFQSINIAKYGSQASSLRLLYALASFAPTPRIYDVIHCHFGSRGLLGMFLKDTGILNGKLVTTFHGADVSSGVRAYGNHIYRRLFAHGDLFLPISRHWKERLIRLGCCSNKIVVHRMGIDCTEFSFRARQLDSSEIVRLISVCRLVEKKGIEFGIRAVGRLVRSMPKLEYNIIGDGPLRAHLEDLIVQLGLHGQVKIHGWKEKKDVIQMLNRAHILLAPSVTAKNGDQEGIPVALMEGMAMGLPVVSTYHSGISELVKDGMSGFLVQERDVANLTERLKFLMEHPETWPAMGYEGRKYVERYFDINQLNDRLVITLQRLLH